jgi:hypothetical protein
MAVTINKKRVGFMSFERWSGMYERRTLPKQQRPVEHFPLRPLASESQIGFRWLTWFPNSSQYMTIDVANRGTLQHANFSLPVNVDSISVSWWTNRTRSPPSGHTRSSKIRNFQIPVSTQPLRVKVF